MTREAGDIGSRVREAVATLLGGGAPDIRLVAQALRTSPRTLQRHLRDAGLTYAHVVAQARFDRARRMLGESTHKIGDIARALGYSDPAHFTRAFLRWTGVTPRDFRERPHLTTVVTPRPRPGRSHHLS